MNRSILSVSAAALLAACGGSQPPTGSPGAVPQSRAIVTHAEHGGSWMAPEAKGDTLLYASGSNLGSVYVFSFPAGKLVGTLSDFIMPTGECVDTAGDVWVADTTYDGKLYEYAHGGTSPIATLNAPDYPMACAIDPKTGNLAVTTGRHTVLIYPGARGKPRSYLDDNIATWYFCAYDSTGNLFLSGENWRYVQRLIEQPYGKSRFATVAGIKGFPEDAPVVWDGKYVAVLAGYGQGTETIDRIRVVGRHGTIEKMVAFRNNPPFNSQFLTFQGSVVQGGIGAIGVWTYARHGKLEKIIKQRNPEIQYLGVAMILTPSR